MQRSVSSHGNERQIDIGFLNAAQFDFRPFGCFLYPLHSHFILGQIDTFGFLEFLDYPFNNFVVEVIAAETSVAVGCKHLEYAVVKFQYGNVERSAAEVVNQYFLFFAFFVESVA